MATKPFIDYDLLNEIITKELKPFVKKVDEEAFYAKRYIETLGKEGFFREEDLSEQDIILKRLAVIEETAKTCMTTAFCIWCHLAATTYITHSENNVLKETVLMKLLNGELLAGTGLSNPLKSFAKLETLHLKAKKVSGGYVINGTLPAVSNIGENHAFAFVAQVDDTAKVMGFVYGDQAGLTLKPRTGYIGVNGSATYCCLFSEVFIPNEQVIATNVDEYIEKIRTRFLAYQIPLALGVTASSVTMMEKLARKHKQLNDNINRFLPIQPDEIKRKNDQLRSRLVEVVSEETLNWDSLLDIRLKSVYLTLEAVQASMLHNGGRGYVKSSVAERKLREAYFLVNLTPTIKHLEVLRNKQEVLISE